jgi:hypothetical protein
MKAGMLLGMVGIAGAAAAIVLGSRSRQRPSRGPSPSPSRIDTSRCGWTWVPIGLGLTEAPGVAKRASDLLARGDKLGTEVFELIGGTIYRFRRVLQQLGEGDAKKKWMPAMEVHRCVVKGAAS